MEGFETPESEALRNEVVWQRLGSYLSPGDLKDCRLVNKTFDKNVRGLKKWKQRMQLLLTRRGDVWGPPGLRYGEDSPTFEAVTLTLSVGGGRSEDAAENAEKAAQHTLDAAREAQGISERAQQAAQKSLEAAEMAQEATQEAREATQVAQQAPRGSQEAAERAKMAAVLAQEASQGAQMAFEKVQETAELAQVAVKKTQETAVLAQTAVNMGQNAAQLVQRADQEAKDAAEEETNSGAQDWSNVFKNVKSLTLEFDERGIRAFDKKELEPVGKTLAFILGHYCTSALQTLIIDGNTLALINLSEILDSSNPDLERILRGLKKLQVRRGKDEHRFVGKLNRQDFTYLANKPISIHNCVQTLGEEMAALEDITIPQTQLMQENFERNVRNLLPPQENFIQSFGQYFLNPRVNDIRKLEIGEIDAVKEESLFVLVFPHLTHLSLRVSSDSGAKLCEFLGKQPSLQGLTLKIHGHLSKTLLKVIKTKGENLVALTLKCWDMDEDEDWDFLASLKKLEEFSFIISSSFERGNPKIVGHVEDIFSAMPKGLRKISIRSGFVIKVTTRHRLLETLRSEAGKLKELEELCLVFLPLQDNDDEDNGDERNDEFLRFIGSKTGEHGMFPFPKLRKLDVSDVTICDEEGELLGEKAFWTGLQDVSIRNVKNVSEDSLIDKLSGTQIRRLSLRGINPYLQMSKEGVQKIVQNNKCLETLTSNHSGIEKAHRLKAVRYEAIDDERDSDSDVETNPSESDDSGGDDGDSEDDDNDAMDEGSDEERDNDAPDLDDVDNV